MLKERKGRSLDEFLAAVDRTRYLSLGQITLYGEFYFLSFQDPDGRSVGRTAITVDEVSHPRLERLL